MSRGLQRWKIPQWGNHLEEGSGRGAVRPWGRGLEEWAWGRGRDRGGAGVQRQWRGGARPGERAAPPQPQRPCTGYQRQPPCLPLGSEGSVVGCTLAGQTRCGPGSILAPGTCGGSRRSASVGLRGPGGDRVRGYPWWVPGRGGRRPPTCNPEPTPHRCLRRIPPHCRLPLPSRILFSASPLPSLRVFVCLFFSAPDLCPLASAPLLFASSLPVSSSLHPHSPPCLLLPAPRPLLPGSTSIRELPAPCPLSHRLCPGKVCSLVPRLMLGLSS